MSQIIIFKGKICVEVSENLKNFRLRRAKLKESDRNTLISVFARGKRRPLGRRKFLGVKSVYIAKTVKKNTGCNTSMCFVRRLLLCLSVNRNM